LTSTVPTPGRLAVFTVTEALEVLEPAGAAEVAEDELAGGEVAAVLLDELQAPRATAAAATAARGQMSNRERSERRGRKGEII
jgi:hypothetical protein